MNTMLIKVAELATALTKTSGIMSGIKGLFKGKQKPLSLSKLLTLPEYASYLTTKFKNPKQRAHALQKIQKKIMESHKDNISPEALLHLTEQKQMLEQMQGMPSEKIWDLLGRYGEYAAENPLQATAGTLTGGYALSKGKELLGEEKPKSGRNVIIAP